jgi:hypothetical protein
VGRISGEEDPAVLHGVAHPHPVVEDWGSSPCVSSSRKTTSGELTNASADEQPLALTARQTVEGLSAQVAQSPASEELAAVDGMVGEGNE